MYMYNVYVICYMYNYCILYLIILGTHKLYLCLLEK